MASRGDRGEAEVNLGRPRRFVPVGAEPFRDIARRLIPPQFSTTRKPGLYESISGAQ
jgi:hypothetical protein